MALKEVNKIENKPFHPDLTIFSFRRQKENAPDEKSKLVFVLNFPDWPDSMQNLWFFWSRIFYFLNKLDRIHNLIICIFD